MTDVSNILRVYLHDSICHVVDFATSRRDDFDGAMGVLENLLPFIVREHSSPFSNNIKMLRSV